MYIKARGTRVLAILGVMAVSLLALLLASCGGGEDPTATSRPTNTPTSASASPDPTEERMDAPTPIADLSGSIAVAGSSTVFPISEAIGEEFSKANSGVRVNVASTGTGAGFRAICAGDTQVSDASRPVKQSELDTCAEEDIELIEVPVAFDALSVVVNPDNDWARCLSVEELAGIFGPEAQGTVTNWNQVRSDFPDSKLRLYGPSTASGTFDYFTEAVIGEGGAHRGDLDLSTEEDPLIARGVNGSSGGIGYFGLAYFAQYRELVKGVEIENPDTGACVAPSSENVENGSYQPLARPIFIYVRADLLDSQPELVAFVEFFLDNAPTIVPEVGYVALPASVYDWARERISNRVTGSVFNEVEPGVSITDALSRIQ